MTKLNVRVIMTDSTCLAENKMATLEILGLKFLMRPEF